MLSVYHSIFCESSDNFFTFAWSLSTTENIHSNSNFVLVWVPMCSHLSWRVVTPLSLQFSHCRQAKKKNKSLARFSAELYSLKPVTVHKQTVCLPEVYISANKFWLSQWVKSMGLASSFQPFQDITWNQELFVTWAICPSIFSRYRYLDSQYKVSLS